MANRWGRNGPYNSSAYMGSNIGVGFYMGGPPPADRRPYGTPVQKPAFGGYRDDNYNRRADRRDDFRGGPRGPSRPKSPSDRRHDGPRRDRRSFNRRQSYPGKYEVRVPKALFNVSARSLTELRHSYPRLNIASDLYECNSLWCDAFPLHSPFKLGSGTDYNVFNREVDAPVPADTSLLSPPDADYSYSVRVMLMACPNLAELYKNTCRMATESNNSDKVLATKSMHFLVGGRTKSETMAIGGPWSPSLDGPNPGSDPKTLINTAIRTFKGYTGLDLSSCNEWLRFMEIRYYRFADSKAPSFVGDEEERTVTSEKPEVVVFFIPDVSHLVPSEEEWEKTKEYYGAILQKLLTPDPEPEAETAKEPSEPEAQADVSIDETPDAEPSSDLEPTHYSKLDVNSLKVNELRNELSARKLDTKGLKVNLVSRLQAALDDERKADSTEANKQNEIKAEETPVKPTSPTTTAKEDPKEILEKDRRRLERLYRLNEKPSIVIHPNKHARGGRFDLHRVSLFSLLDYRSEDMKELNFEVALFAEQFHEMLQRDCAFTIFKAINDAPEKEAKPELDGKHEGLENGVDKDEPDSKRRRLDSQSQDGGEEEEEKVRHLRRTVHPDLLFAFTYFDTGRSGYIREHDLCEILHLLGLRYSKAQMRKLVSKVLHRRDHVTYHQLTDDDIVEGDDRDVVTLRPPTEEDVEVTKMLALGNRALFDIEEPPVPSKITIGGGNVAAINKRMEKAEEQRKQMEFQFVQIKDELEKTRVQYNTVKDTVTKLRSVNSELSDRLKSEQKQAYEHKSLYSTYHHLLRSTRDHMDHILFDINKQFDKEKAKREAEKAALEAEKAKAEESESKDKDTEMVEKTNEEAEKTEDKEWQVVDAV